VAAVPGEGAPAILSGLLTNGRTILCICLLSIAAYSNSLSGDFVFDDIEQIVENQAIRSWDNLGRAFTTNVWAFRENPADTSVPPPLPYYRPLFTVLLTIEFKLFGLWPQGWHLTSLLLHVVCAIEVFYLLTFFGSRLIAAFASILFAIHPVHAESVCWISGVTDPLYTVFLLGSLCLYLKVRTTRETGSEERAGKRPAAGFLTESRSRALSLFLFVAAAYSKETALTLVLFVFAFEILNRAGGLKQRLIPALRCTAPYAAAALVYLIPRYLVLRELMFSNPQADPRPAIQTLLTLPFVITSYLFHLAWPVDLSVTYATRFIQNVGEAGFVLPAAALVALLIAIVLLRKRVASEVWFALSLIIVPLLPVLKLGQVSREEYLVFDHYLYLPVAGWCWLLGMALFSRRSSPKTERSLHVRGSVRGSMAAAMVGLALFGAIRENAAWANSYSLWSKAARVRPDYWAAHYNAGLALLDNKRFDEARTSLETAARLGPSEATVFDALGRAHAATGDLESASSSFEHAIKLDPALYQAYNNLGQVRFEEKNYPEAARNFERALQVNPAAVASRFNLALCYARQARLAEAEQQFRLVLESARGDAEAYYQLGLVCERQGELTQAKAAFESGLSRAGSPGLARLLEESLSRIASHAQSPLTDGRSR
jgi:tetratricopeptide (TPR) repeat protein